LFLIFPISFLCFVFEVLKFENLVYLVPPLLNKVIFHLGPPQKWLKKLSGFYSLLMAQQNETNVLFFVLAFTFPQNTYNKEPVAHTHAG